MELNEKQQHILKVAMELFAEQGYSGTSVRNIAEAANVNLSMISYYFNGKEGLMKALIISQSTKMRVEVQEALSDPSLSPKLKMEHLIDELVDRFWENRVLFKIIIREQHFDSTNELKDVMNNIRDNRLSLLTSIINEGQDAGVFNKKVQIPLLHATIIGTLKNIYFSDDFYYEILKLQGKPNKDELLLNSIKTHIKTIFNLMLNEK